MTRLNTPKWLTSPVLARPLVHALVFAVVLGFSGGGLGYRHLWQDEVETAERARTILESGYPRVIDRSGAVSVNTGGREIEEGDAHRYSPWVQFYVAAAGLEASRIFHFSPDKGVRLPFIIAHAAVAGLASYGLETYAEVPRLLAVGIGLALGAQSVPLVHARTARYHALLDLFFVLGLFAIGALRPSRRWPLPVLGSCIFLLPQVQTLGGSALSLGLGVLAFVQVLQAGDKRRIFRAAAWIAVPALFSIIGILVLTRPWLQSAWGGFSRGHFHSLGDFFQIQYALAYAFACAIHLSARKAWRTAAVLWAGLATLYVTVYFLDFYSFSQTRYYISFIYLALLWPLYTRMEAFSARSRVQAASVLLAVALFPDVLWTQRARTGAPPFQGIRIAWHDAASERTGQRQPLQELLDYIRQHAGASDPVLIDYVPQFVNWYLPGHPVALIPDKGTLTRLGAKNPIWQRPLSFPRWHIWYTISPGLWICGKSCDYTIHGYDPARGTYFLDSQSLKTSRKMCVIEKFATHPWNNAPFRLLSPESDTPSGGNGSELILGAPCRPRAPTVSDTRNPPGSAAP